MARSQRWNRRVLILLIGFLAFFQHPQSRAQEVIPIGRNLKLHFPWSAALFDVIYPTRWMRDVIYWSLKVVQWVPSLKWSNPAWKILTINLLLLIQGPFLKLERMRCRYIKILYKFLMDSAYQWVFNFLWITRPPSVTPWLNSTGWTRALPGGVSSSRPSWISSAPPIQWNFQNWVRFLHNNADIKKKVTNNLFRCDGRKHFFFLPLWHGIRNSIRALWWSGGVINWDGGGGSFA